MERHPDHPDNLYMATYDQHLDADAVPARLEALGHGDMVYKFTGIYIRATKCSRCGREVFDKRGDHHGPALDERCEAPAYQSQAARDAQRIGYGSKSYWDYLDKSAIEDANGPNAHLADHMGQSLAVAIAQPTTTS